MKVILSKDIEGLGEEGDIKEVTGGYARNYLLPKQLVVPHSNHNLMLLEQKKTAIEARKEEKRKEAMSLKEKLEAEELVFAMPAGERGKLFGSVNNALIAQELEKRGFSIERKRIDVPEHNIRMTGNFKVTVKLYEHEEAFLNVVVEKEA